MSVIDIIRSLAGLGAGSNPNSARGAATQTTKNIQAPKAVFSGGGGGFGGLFSNIDDAILALAKKSGNQVVNYAKQYGNVPGQAGQPNINDLLAAYANQTYQGPSQADLEAQARAQIAAQFGPQYSAIDQAISSAKRETSYNKAGIASLYDTLAKSYPTDIKGVKATFKEAGKREKAINKTERTAIAEGYAQAQHDLANTMKQLGVEAAGGSVLPGFAKDEAAALQDAAQRYSGESSATSREQQAQEAYYGQGPSLARQGSVNAQEGLTSELQRFILDENAKRQQIGVQEGLSYKALLGDLQGQASQAAQQFQNDQFSQLMRIAQLQQGQARIDISREKLAQSGEPSILKGEQGALNMLQQYGASPSTKLAQDLAQFESMVLGNPDNQGIDYYKALNLLQKFIQGKPRYNPQDARAMQEAVAALFGKF